MVCNFQKSNRPALHTLKSQIKFLSISLACVIVPVLLNDLSLTSNFINEIAAKVIDGIKVVPNTRNHILRDADVNRLITLKKNVTALKVALETKRLHCPLVAIALTSEHVTRNAFVTLGIKLREILRKMLLRQSVKTAWAIVYWHDIYTVLKAATASPFPV